MRTQEWITGVRQAIDQGLNQMPFGWSQMIILALDWHDAHAGANPHEFGNTVAVQAGTVNQESALV